jgi:hypothetical protein
LVLARPKTWRRSHVMEFGQSTWKSDQFAAKRIKERVPRWNLWDARLL